jgi:hypothetical protein
MQLDFEIDKLTRSIENVVTGDSFQTQILPLAKADLLQITKRNGWKFNWEAEYLMSDKEIFKLSIIGNPTVIQGLISISIDEGFMEMNLIESAPFNLGKTKMYYGVAGNLVAFACKRSFDHGFDGYVAFTAKTSLIEHYKKTLGAVQISFQRMMIQEPQAKILVSKYFSDFKIK